MTFILEEYRNLLAKHSEELSVEGIDSIDYWMMKLDIDLEEFQEFASQRINTGIEFADTPEAGILAAYLEAFFIGYQLGRRRKDWRPT